MKRLHVNLAVADLDASIRFYASLFNAQPSVLKEDYAKWMLEDPRVNFAITTRGARKGIDHLGIQVDNADELGEVSSRLKNAGAPIVEQGDTTCCYARSEKNWIFDPEGIAWETFLTKGESAIYGSDLDFADTGSACCAGPERQPAPPEEACCEVAVAKDGAAGLSGCCA